MASKQSVLAARDAAISDAHLTFDKEVNDIREASLAEEADARNRALEAIAKAHAEYNAAITQATEEDEPEATPQATPQAVPHNVTLTEDLPLQAN